LGTPVDPTLEEGVLHWIILLKVEGGNHVVLDMAPVGSDGRNGVLIVRSEGEAKDLTANAITLFNAGFGLETANITAKGVIDWLISQRRNRYRFMDDGSGCRYWCETVLADMEAERIVSSDSSHDFVRFIVEHSKVMPSRYPAPTRMGTFY
jgi:hypothetical protein